jgi:hypothetical protein
MGSAKVLEATVQPKHPSQRMDFAYRAVAALQSDPRLDAVAIGDVVLVSGVWYPDVDRAADLLGAAWTQELTWSEPQIRYRFETVESAGRRKQIELEPILLLEVSTPPEFIGNVIGDLSSRRGLLTGQRELDAHAMLVVAEVPLAELRGYLSTLAALTQGNGEVSATVLKYSERPPYIGPSDEPVSMALRA